MKVVAFLQNMWVRNPERIKRAFEQDGEDFRLRFIEYALFRGCVTGRRLRKAFGDLCEEIVREETTREIADNPKTIYPAQPEHIKAVIAKHEPDIILTFGKIAFTAVSPIWTGRMIACPHPAARQSTVPSELLSAAEKLKSIATEIPV